MGSSSLLLLRLLLLPPNWFGFTGRTRLGAVGPAWPGRVLVLPGRGHCCPQTLGSPAPAACFSDVREANQWFGDAHVVACCAEMLCTRVQ